MAILTQSNTPRYEGRRVTREEYLDLPDDGFKYDMENGVLHLSPSAFFNHGFVSSRFQHLLQAYLDKRPVGMIVNEIDIFLPDGGDVLRPDISFILEENRGIILGHIHGTPDLVCEVLSDETRVRDLGIKADRYLFNGVKEYWILDPSDKSIQVWISRKDHWNKHILNKNTAGVLQSELLAGLKISLDDIYARMPE